MILKNKLFILLFGCVLFSSPSIAQSVQRGTVEWKVRLGFNMGGTTPLPLPAEIRKIESYSPKFNPSLGIAARYVLTDKWGIETGLSLETKGMEVTDHVKYMYTSVVLSEGGKPLTGYFVGNNRTNVDMGYLTLPVYGSYKINDRWNTRLGIYAAKVLSRKFSGDVSDGYLRVGEPTGPKQEITKATFDFSKNIRDFDFGLSGGADCRIAKKISGFVNVNWGLTPFFAKNDNPLQFNLHNIYGTLGVAYRLSN